MPRTSLLCVGGARSGKSGHASRWALARPGPRVYVATARPPTDDQDFAGRIARHQADRSGQEWRTVEEPLAVCTVLRRAADEGATTAVVDCATLWLCNLGEANSWQVDPVLAEVDRLAALLRDPPLAVAVVSNEVGQGIVPLGAVSRIFVDLQGWANQRLAAAAQRVDWLVCGLPQRLK